MYVATAVETCNCHPMGTLLTRLPRLTLAQLRTLWSTTGCTCCRDLAKFPSPDGKIAYMVVSTLTCTTAADSLVNYYRMYVQQRTFNYPMAPMGKLLTCLP